MKPSIITISRQFGSGGRQIGAYLSKRLEIPCYEKSLFEAAAKHSGIHQMFFEEAEGHTDRYYANIFSSGSTSWNMSLDDRMYLALAETIRELAEQGPCIIVGRGANKILQDRKDVLNIFIHAEKTLRLKRIVNVYGVPEERAEKTLKTVDKNRADYLKFYTSQVFGSAENYHLCIDSGKFGIENTADIIETIYRTL